LGLWADGTIKPGDTLSHAAEVLGTVISKIATFSRRNSPS